MKTKSIIFSVVIAAFLSSSIPTGSHRLEIGSEAPSLTLSPTSPATLESLKGKKIILNFWSASDASSRLANLRISELAESEANAGTAYVSVCIDKDPTLAKEIARIDKISDKVISLGLDDVVDDVITDYQTARGCRTFSIDAYGNLEAIAPASEISTILS